MSSAATKATLDKLMAKWAPMLKGVPDPSDEDAPAWIKHGMEIIKRSQVRDLLYEPIVSVQPMSGPVGGLARWEPSAVDRLAALADPNGELAKRIAGYDKIGEFKYYSWGAES